MNTISIAGLDPAAVILEIWRATPGPVTTFAQRARSDPSRAQIREDFLLGGVGILGVHKRPILSGCADYRGRWIQIAVDAETDELRGPGVERARPIVERMRARLS